MKHSRRTPVFILGLGISGYGVIRALARHGIPMVGFYRKGDEVGRFSRHVRPLALAPDLPEKGVCDLLVAHAWRSPDKPVLFATTDEYTWILARNRQRLSEYFRFHWIDEARLNRIIDKARMQKFCMDANVLAPRTYITRPDEDLRGAADGFRYPCLLKPTRNFSTTFPLDEKNRVVPSRETLMSCYQRNPKLRGNTIWQEIIEGDDSQIYQCTALVCRSGKIGGICTVQKLRQCPPGFGSMCFGRTAENSFVVSESLRILGLISYRGFASLEFKFQPRDKRYYFIEMNPRLPWYNAVLHRAGVNLAHAAYLDLVGSPGDATTQAEGVAWVSASHDRQWFMATRGRRSLSRWAWVLSLLRAHSYAWWSSADPTPFVAALALPWVAAVLRAGRRVWDRVKRTIFRAPRPELPGARDGVHASGIEPSEGPPPAGRGVPRAESDTLRFP